MSDNNTNPPDEFQNDQVEFDEVPEDGGFEDFEGGGGTTLGDMWRNNPLVKIGVIAGGLITVIGAIILFGGGQDPALKSVMKGGQDVNQAPGGEISEEMRNAIKEKNEEVKESAIRNQGSAIPTPVDTPVSRLNLPEDENAGEDPLERWRRIQEERQRQTSQKKPEVQMADPYAGAIDALAQAMATQMESILGTKTALEPKHIVVTEVDFFNKKREDAAKAAQQKDEEGGKAEDQIVNILVPAGSIEYAQLIVEANSDAKGPILAEMVSGPFAGSRLLGKFEVKDEFLILTFDTIVIDGIGHSTSAVAIEPETTSIAMVSDIDHRYFSRVILPAAAKFVEGMGSAIADSQETTVVLTDGGAAQSQEELNPRQEFAKGFEEASSRISEFLDEEADKTEPMIKVRSGTGMGLFFVEPVTDETR